MPDSLEAVVLAVLVLSTSIWVGGYVAIAVVARTASKALTPQARIAFFRTLGRAYFRVGTPALVVALVTGAILAVDGNHHGGTFIAAVVVAIVLILSFAVAVVQARRMTRLRRRLAGSPDDAALTEQVRTGARAAGILRGALGLLSLVLIVLGAFLAT